MHFKNIYLHHKKFVISIIFCVIILAVSLIVLSSKQHTIPLSNEVVIPTQIPVPKKVIEVIDHVKQKTLLPQGETPSVATVTDVSKLPKDPFFVKAQSGDKVLIYSTAKKAYLYRPSTDQIIQESSVEIMGDISQEASPSASIDASDSAQISPILKIKY